MSNFRFLFIYLLASLISALALPAKAQISPDDTLGMESSTVTSGIVEGETVDLIEGGATRGENLFHSFLDFNINADKPVYFNSPENIETILGRVTGSSLSSINGLLGTRGGSDAALILMNPNGIVFGENAALDTQGAFTATTATSIQLGEEGLFSAIDPASDQLLSVDPSAFFFNELSTASSGIQVEGTQGLRVNAGESLSLVGGSVKIGSSGINTPDSRVEIVAVGDATAVVVENGKITLGEDAHRGSVLIEDGSFVDVRSPEGGSIALVADDVQVLANSRLFAGVQPDSEQFDSTVVEEAVNSIEIDATGLVQISGAETILESSVLQGASSSSEGVFVRAGSIEVSDGAEVYTITLDGNSAGNVVLSADANILVDDAQVYATEASSEIAEQGGNILLSGKNIGISGDSTVGTFALGGGDAGNVDIVAIDTIEVSGVGSASSSIFSIVGESSEGNGGDIAISSSRFDAIGDIFIGTTTFAAGKAGDVYIEAADKARFGAERSATRLGILSTSTGEQASTQGGNIEIRSPNVEILNGFVILTGTDGKEDAGNIKIEASDLLRIDGFNSVSDIPSTSSVGSLAINDATGQAGAIEIVVGNIEVTNGGNIGTPTNGSSNAGAVRVEVAESAIFDGFSSRSLTASGIRNTSAGGSGNGGEVQLSATNLDVTNGARLITSSIGEGDGGDIEVNVLDTIRLDGVNSENGSSSSISSDILGSGSGDSGSVKVNAANLVITNGADIGADVFGQGNAGDVFVDVVETIRVDGINPVNSSSPSNIGSGIQSDAVGRGGNVVITATEIELSNGGQIDTSVFGEGEAGNVTLTVSEAIRIDGVNPINGRSPSNVGSGIRSTRLERESKGGTVNITTGSLDVTNGGLVDTISFGRGDAGSIVISASGRVRLDGTPITGAAPSSVASSIEADAVGDGGTVEISAADLEITNGAQIDASVFGKGDAGDILLNISETIQVRGGDLITGEVPSSIGSAVVLDGVGNGGDVDISATELYVIDESQITAANTAEGDAGRIVLRIEDLIRVEDGGDIVTRAQSGTGGEINIESGGVVLRDNGDIRTFVNAKEGTGGSVSVDANYIVALDDSDILAFSVDGRGGNVDLTQTTLFSQRLNPIAETIAGDISEDALLALDGNNRVDVNASGGIESGQILINDASFIENELSELPDSVVDTEALIANACVARSNDAGGTFVLRESDRPSQSPINTLSTSYSTGTVQPVLSTATTAIQEPQAIYQLANGRSIISHQCKQ